MFFADIGLYLLLEGIVVHCNAVPQLATNVRLTVQEWRSLLLFNHVPTVRVYIDQAVGRLKRGSVSTKGLLEHDSLLLDAHIDIVEAPPHILLPVEDEGVVMAALGRTIVDQDSVQVVGNVPVITKCGPHLVLFLLNLLCYSSHLTFNGMLVRRQYIRCIDQSRLVRILTF